ncbi:MAG: DNA (cytosine-5-)-methyltransferase, partial [Gammaproteobacteria bacterium]
MNHAINQWTAIDLFCGAGGLSEGFRQAGFHILVGNDANVAAAQTFQAAHRATQFLDGPIEHLPARRFLKASQLAKGQLDCLIGGPPCQAYSVYNHQRGLHDKRSLLFNDYLRIVNGLMPGWVVLENVTGILSIGEGKVVNDIMHQLRKLGYHVEYRILKAEEYGVPQERRRVVFLGNRWGIPISWPEVTHSDVHNTTMHPIVTVKDALYDLPILRNGEAAPNAAYRTSPKSAYQKMLRGHTPYVLNHAAPRLAPINLERMRHIPPGGSWRDVPVHLLPRGMQKARRCDHTKRYGRLAWHGLAS